MKNDELNPRQKEMLAFIAQFCEEHGYPPTVREIGAAVGLKSTSNVHAYLKALEKKGYIRRDAAHQRTISVIRPANACAEESYRIPVVASNAAGNRVFSFNDVQGYVPLNAEMLRGADAKDVFILTIEGESMIKAGILSGDSVIVQRGAQVSDGELCVARISAIYGDAATVKKFYREQNSIRLQPENDAMNAITVPADSVEIIGKVIGLLRKY